MVIYNHDHVDVKNDMYVCSVEDLLNKMANKMALAGFILALLLFGFIGSYSLHSILETNRNALIYDKLSLQNSKGIGINLISSSRTMY